MCGLGNNLVKLGEKEKKLIPPKNCFCEYTDFNWNCNVNSSEDLCILRYMNLVHFVFILTLLTLYCSLFYVLQQFDLSKYELNFMVV